MDTSRPKTPAVIFDMDGTLSDYSHRAHYIAATTPGQRDWPAFFAAMEEDGLIEDTFRLLKKCRAEALKIIILTGRPDTYIAPTLRWLERHGVLYDVVMMRPGNDWRPGAEVKAELFQMHIAPVYQVKFAVEDNPKIAAMWQELGVKCIQVSDGSLPETY